MIKMLTAHTLEPDDPQAATEDILRQLDLKSRQMKNTAAFLTCSYDFIETGAVEQLCRALPFDVVGCTTLMNATDGEADTMMLALTVLTSDSCSFSASMSQSLGENMQQSISCAWETAAAALPEKAALVLAFAPLIREVGGELILNALDDAVGGAPIFGTIGSDQDTSEYSETHTIFNGRCSRDGLAVLAISGNISPYFLVASASEDKIQKQKAIITSSEGSVVREINNTPTIQYLKTLGLTKGDGVEGMSAIPFIVNYNDGTQSIARAIYMLTPEGYAVCGGAMPEGATLSIGAIDYEDILLTAGEAMDALLATGRKNGLILFPCLGRNLVLGTDIRAEIDLIESRLSDSGIPYHLSYSGGEICPVYGDGEKTLNRFHNFTFIACIF